MQIEGRQRVALGDDFDAFELRQQRLQRRLNLADDTRAARRQQRRIADELDGVAKTLLGVKQNGLAGNRFIAEP